MDKADIWAAQRLLPEWQQVEAARGAQDCSATGSEPMVDQEQERACT